MNNSSVFAHVEGEEKLILDFVFRLRSLLDEIENSIKRNDRICNTKPLVEDVGFMLQCIGARNVLINYVERPEE